MLETFKLRSEFFLLPKVTEWKKTKDVSAWNQKEGSNEWKAGNFIQKLYERKTGENVCFAANFKPPLVLRSSHR